MTTRILTAIVFVAVMLGGLYGGLYPFVGLLILITVLCLWEFIGLTLVAQNPTNIRHYKVVGTIMGVLPVVITGIYKLGIPADPFIFLKKATILSIPFVFLIFVRELFANTKEPFTNLAYLFLGIFYIGLPMSMLLLVGIEGETYLPNTVFGILLLTWANDSGAYLIGSKIGKTPLFPRISPNKTWEGSIGGAITALIAGFLLSLVFKEQSMFNWLIIAGLTIVFGSIGDLIESMLKRSKGVKDSGSFLPGHGGFLDRFDAFIFVVPFVAAFLLYIRS